MLKKIGSYVGNEDNTRKTISILILVIVLMVGLIIGFVGGTALGDDIHQQKILHDQQIGK